MRLYFSFIFLLLSISILSCRFDPEVRSVTTASTGFNNDSIIKIEIQETGKMYSINDSAALALIQQVPELRQLIDYKYDDSTIYNQLHIENVPTGNDNNWHIQIVQFQPKTEHATSLLRLLVDANNGKISIWDVQKDTVIPIDTWLRQRIKN